MYTNLLLILRFYFLLYSFSILNSSVIELGSCIKSLLEKDSFEIGNKLRRQFIPELTWGELLKKDNYNHLHYTKQYYLLFASSLVTINVPLGVVTLVTLLFA